MFPRYLLLLSPVLLAWASAVEPIKELKLQDAKAESGRAQSENQMKVAVKPEEFVLLTYREYEGGEDGPEAPAKRVVERVIRPLSSPHQEVLHTDLYFHPGPKSDLPVEGKSTLGGFGQRFVIKDLACTGSSGGSRSAWEQPVYVSKKFNFGDNLNNPQKKRSVRFTMEVISREQMLAKLRSAGISPPVEIPKGWSVELPEKK